MQERNEFEQALRPYRLDELLIISARKSQLYYQNNHFWEEFNVPYVQYGHKKEHLHRITAWELAELSYTAIRMSNDYRGKSSTDYNYFQLNNIQKRVNNDNAGAELKLIKPEDTSLAILFGLSQEQFWYQQILSHKFWLYSFIRYYILLKEIPEEFEHKRKPNEDLKEITGFSIDEFSQILFFIQAFFMQGNSAYLNPEIPKEVTGKIPILTTENVTNVLNLFSGSYDDMRKIGEKVKNNPFFIKPIIKTDRRNLFLVSNLFLWMRKFYEGIYWIIRDKYFALNKQDFINDFGEYYEKYVEKLLSFYLDKAQYKRIVESDTKRADWVICTQKYLLVIEQKSNLMSLALKKEFPSMSVLDKYLDNFREAFLQIDNTIKDLYKNDSRIKIKIVLHFEDLYIGKRLVGRVKEMTKDDILDLNYYFSMPTENFEKFIQVLGESIPNFEEIIDRAISFERNPNPAEDGSLFGFIEKVHPVNEITFLEKQKEYFDDLLKEIE